MCIQELTADGSTGVPDTGQMEIFSSWALFIMIMLLIAALFTSYMLQQKKVEAVHETVISIFAGTVIRILLNTT
jgi:sodium/hydrogen exchanger-like protein 6/7